MAKVGIGPAAWPAWGRVALSAAVLVAGGLLAADGMGAFTHLRPAAPATAAAPAATGVGVRLAVTVTGPAQAANIDIVEGGAVVYRSGDVPLPFTWTGTRTDPNSGLVVTAAGFDAPSVACQVTVAGRVVSDDRVTGGSAHCGG